MNMKGDRKECYDKLPEGLQVVERGEQMYENIESLEEIIEYLEEADYLGGL